MFSARSVSGYGSNEPYSLPHGCDACWIQWPTSIEFILSRWWISSFGMPLNEGKTRALFTWLQYASDTELHA